ncbi:MAG TPA: chorismate mutase, partial [Brevundimonas sp.]
MTVSTLNPSTNSTPLKQVWPADMNPAEMTPEQMVLTALRHEIDLIDDQILELFERRLAIAASVGKAKDAPHGPHTKLRPDREQTVLGRVLSQCQPENVEAVSGLWREIVGWGLARQGTLQVQVWAPNDPTRAFDG